MIATLRRTATLFSMILGLAGCGHREFRCWLHPEHVDRKPELEVAAQVWNEKAYDQIVVADEADGDVEIKFVSREWLTKYTNEKRARIGAPLVPEDQGVDGLYEYDSGDRKVYLNEDLRGINLIAISAHEFGHLNGVPHTDGGLMDPHGGFPTIDPVTLAECRRVNACP
jgi:hypothetical protein